MFDKKTCERCGKKYMLKTMSENKGKHYCSDCIKKCLVCDKNLPLAHWFGRPCSVTQGLIGNVFTQAMEKTEKPWIGSGLCIDCYNAKVKQEEDEKKLIRTAQLREAKDIIETPVTWDCPYCKAVNRGNFCSNCGSPRRREVRTNST